METLTLAGGWGQQPDSCVTPDTAVILMCWHQDLTSTGAKTIPNYLTIIARNEMLQEEKSNHAGYLICLQLESRTGILDANLGKFDLEVIEGE